MRADPQTERDIFAAVDAYLDHLAERRLDDALACFAPDPDAALYGSEVGEVAIGPDALRAFLQKLLARPFGPRFTLAQRTASIAGDVAWFTAEAEIEVGSIRLAHYRLTGVLEKRGDHWLWLLFNGSEPAPDRA
jgi:ketosteroid isomerase-like protein